VIAAPLRLSRDRVLLYGALLAAVCLVQVRFVVAQGFGDWSAFWSAGATAGTPNLLDPSKHTAWQTAHHLLTTVFPYLPGAAWFWFPFKPLSLSAGYFVNLILMAAAIVIAGGIAARVYAIRSDIATILVFAWAPVTAALATGQNSPAALVIALIAILGLSSGMPLMAGFAVGALLYKLPYALPLILLLIARRNIAALAVTFACAILWYVLSVAATAGDWNWPAHYLGALQAYFGPDARFNAVKTVGIPSLLMRAGISAPIAALAGAALFAVAVPLLVRRPLLEAAALALLAGLAASPHTLPYDLALALPALFYLVTHLAEPLRTRLICALYLIAPLWLLSGVLHFDVLAVICDGLTIAWILKGYDEPAPGTNLDIADPRNRSEAKTLVD